MAELQLRQSETHRDRLPDVCMACGQPAADQIRKTFSWYPPWVIVTIVAGLLPFAIIAAVLTKRMTVEVPVCDKHRGYWWKRYLLMTLPLLLLAGLGVGGAIALDDAGMKDAVGMVCLGFGLLLLMWVVVIAVIQSLMVRPAEITDRGIRLKGVSDEFVAAFEAGRLRRYDDDDDLDDRPRRRGRSDDYDDRPPDRDDRFRAEDDDRPRRRAGRDEDDRFRRGDD